MEECTYTPVDNVESQAKESGVSKKWLLRQLFVSSGIWASYFAYGLSFGSPTVIIPQMRQEANSTDAITTEMASWMSSVFCYSGLMGAVILSIFSRLIGRKFSHFFVCITSLIGYIIFYFSKTAIHIIISEMVLGPLAAAPITLSIMILTEYISPRYRGIFLTLKSAAYLWGVWVANTIGTFLHWRNIGILGFICILYSFCTSLFWPESPYWLVAKSRFNDCATSHRWLKGYSEESETELKALLDSRNVSIATNKTHNCFRKIQKMIISKLFYKPMLLCILILALFNSLGIIACGMYAVDIIKNITKTDSTAYMGMLILDGTTMLGMYGGCIFSKICRRRSLLLISTGISILFLFSISIYLYLINENIILQNSIVTIMLLIGYFLTISVGPMMISNAILGELIPVKYRSFSALLVGCAGYIIMGLFINITPFIIEFWGIHCLFLVFAVSGTLCTYLTYKFLPETKDKSLLEIQDCLLGPEKNLPLLKIGT